MRLISLISSINGRELYLNPEAVQLVIEGDNGDGSIIGIGFGQNLGVKESFREVIFELLNGEGAAVEKIRYNKEEKND